MSSDAKWTKLRSELTNKADIFVKSPISNTIALSKYYQVSERIFALAEQARDQKEWDKLYIYMKRYMMLTARELKKHNAFGQTRYRVDRETARARCQVAIDNIKFDKWVQQHHVAWINSKNPPKMTQYEADGVTLRKVFTYRRLPFC